ncbi:MAG: nucleoid-associated protein [Pseudomonadota bacterium]
MKLIKLIVHAIDKTPDAGAARLNLCQQEMQDNENLVTFISDLNSNFNSKSAKTHGAFSTNPHDPEQQQSEQQDNPILNHMLSDYMKGNLPFVDFSHKSMDFLKTLMDRNGKTKGGYVVFAHYQLFATDFLFVVILHNQSALLIDEKLQLNQTEYLDTSSLYLAARIDLSEWQEPVESSVEQHKNRYIAMIIARDGKKINDYFKEFIGFEETVDAKKETSQLLDALTGFCHQSQAEPEVTEELKKKAVEYCSQQAEAGENVQLKDFSSYVSEMAEEDFYRYLQNEKVEIQEEITPDRGLLRKFNKLSGRSGNLSISFPASLLNQSVFYDTESDTLTINNPPKSLREQLLLLVNQESKK